MTTATQIQVPVGDAALDGDLVIPETAKGIVLFAHGSGSGRHSPRNRMVAETLNERGFGTLLVDLLTPDEEELDRVTFRGAGRARGGRKPRRRLVLALSPDWGR